jgi:hypothetical protein|tara:strand:+ start:2607 stop:3782 length:1176 start_codon:yes stop_codon:yes gene_type:complete
MADTLFFSRDTKVYVAPLNASGAEVAGAIWEIPVLDGFSFSQATNSSEITLNEMEASGGGSRRGRKMFNDSYAPAEWSFSTYARPFKSASYAAGGADNQVAHHAVEEALWAMMVGNAGAGYTVPTGSQVSVWAQGLTQDGTDLDIDFDDSNTSTLGTANIYFVLGKTGETATTYKVANCCMNEASMDFDIDGIATIAWSGMGTIITEATAPTATRYEAIGSTTNFIRNRLTQLVMTTADDHLRSTGESADGDTDAETYALTLTGGNITISNNMTFLTPETLGVVNQPLGHVTGTRTIGGSFTCYLNSTAEGSMDLFERIIEDSDTITNKFDLNFKVGGASATPRIELNMAACHLEVPTHSIDDVISLEVNFHALGTDISSTDEIAIKYIGA